MNFPVAQLTSTGAELVVLAQNFQSLSAEAELINSAINECYGVGGVHGQIGGVITMIKSQADSLYKYSEVSAQAARIYSNATTGIGILGLNSNDTLKQSSSLLNSLFGDKWSAKNLISSISIGQNSSASDVAKDIWDKSIDKYRENNGRTGQKESNINYTYSSTKSGNVSILGTDFHYTKYRDYISGNFEINNGNSFDSFDTEFSREAEHIDFIATDGSELSGDITMNGISLYADGEFDLAKGNAFVKAGADYTVASITIDAKSDFGGVSLTGEVGAGTHLNAGIHDGKITIDASAAFVAGLGFSIEINYENLWDAVCSVF